MKSILALVLLSMFMAIPASAERKLVEKGRFVSTQPPPAAGEGVVDHYYWGIYFADDTALTTVPILQNTTLLPETTVVPTVAMPYGKRLKLRVWPGISNPLGRGTVPSELSEEFSIYENFDFNKNGVINLGDVGYAAAHPVSLSYVARAASLFSYRIVNGEYVP